MNPDVTASQYRHEGVRDNGVLVTVAFEVLQEIARKLNTTELKEIKFVL